MKGSKAGSKFQELSSIIYVSFSYKIDFGYDFKESYLEQLIFLAELTPKTFFSYSIRLNLRRSWLKNSWKKIEQLSFFSNI